MMARATRAMAETSLREEGHNGFNNQLSTKVAAMVRTVVGSNGIQCKMDGSSDQDGRWWQDHNGWQQRRWATAAQWAVERQNNCDGQSSAMGGKARWTAAVITMDGGSKIAMDGSSDNGQQQHNGWWNSKGIAMGNETAMVTTATITQKLAAVAAAAAATMTTTTMTTTTTTMTTTTMTTIVDAVGRNGHHQMRKWR
jgi:hypothetical protein